MREDEELFAGVALKPVEVCGSINVVLILIMDDAGTLKTLVYGQLFRAFPQDAR